MKALGSTALVSMAICLGLSTPLRAEVYNISLIYSLTGPFAFAGVQAAKAAQIGIDEANASGKLGKNSLKLLTYDDASNTSQTRVLISRAAVGDNALMILGPTGSIQAQVAGPAANDLKVPLLSNASTTELLKAGPWTFKVAAAPPDPIIPLARYAIDKLHAKRVALVYQRDNDAEVAFAKAFGDYATAHGAQVVADQSIVGSDTDFTVIGTKLAQAAPDTMFLGANATQAANVVVQAKQAGVTADLHVFGPAGLGPEYVKAGGQAVEGTYCYADYDPGSSVPLNAAFVQNYQKRYNEAPNNFAGLGYSAALIAAAAIERAGPNPTREKVQAVLANIHDVPVVMGDGKWGVDATHKPVYEMQVLKIKDGKFISAP